MPPSRLTYEINRTSSASPQTLFALETDGANWSQWSKPVIAQSSWERRTAPQPGGVGDIRKVGRWPLFLHEETLEYDQDRRHLYRFTGPFQPVKNYQAEVTFTPNPNGGTDLRWTGSFTPSPLPGIGPASRLINRLIVQAVAKRLIRAAERTNP